MDLAAHVSELTMSCVNSITNVAYFITQARDPNLKSMIEQHLPLHIQDYNTKVIERLFIGKTTPVIQDGKIIFNNLKKLRLSVDQLEERLREKGISSITDVKNASIEITGQIGYELMKHAKPVTHEDLEKILDRLSTNILQQFTVNERNLFNEPAHDDHIKKQPN